MKKLMFAAALAATGMTFAATPEAQVYDVCLSIKTTEAASANLSHKDNAFLENTDKEYVVYRKQASKSWKGLIWGCDCEGIDGVWEEVNEIGDTGFKSVKGCVIWDTKTKKPVYFGSESNLGKLNTVPGTGFGWDFINAIDKNGKKCEAAWTMVQYGDICEDTEWEEEGAELFNFKGAGFGTLCLFLTDDEVNCSSYVKSVSGNFAGYMKAPYKVKDTDWSGCTFCGYDPIAGSCDPAEAWNYCSCEDFSDIEKTAAYGTWSVKYNSSLSQKLSKTPAIKEGEIENLIISIRQVYKFPEAVAAGILAVETYIWDVDVNGCDELAHALALAKQATYAAEQAVEASKYENLKAAVATAEAALAKAEYAQYASETNYAAKVVAWQNATNALAIAQASTNQAWTITWKNSSQDKETAEGKGTDSMIAKFVALKTFTIYEATYGNTIFINDVEKNATATCTALNKAVETAEKNLVTATAAKTAAAAAVKAADAEVVKANDAVTAAKNNLANIDLLQYKAAQDLAKAEAAEAIAQKAYDDNNCDLID